MYKYLQMIRILLTFFYALFCPSEVEAKAWAKIYWIKCCMSSMKSQHITMNSALQKINFGYFLPNLLYKKHHYPPCFFATYQTEKSLHCRWNFHLVRFIVVSLYNFCIFLYSLSYFHSQYADASQTFRE